jgi:NTE family protein
MVVLGCAVAGCSTVHYPINPPLARIDADAGYRIHRVFERDPADSFYLQVSFSGGGARAAALGFGVLEALRDTSIDWQARPQRLIDQVDLVMGLSGGSLIASYFALKGPDGFADFEDKFLQARLQRDLLWRLGSPRTWWRLGSKRFGRSEVLAELLDERLYDGTTFSTLSATPRKPFLVLHATDMNSGSRFEFIQEQFDYLCSDLDAMPVARAVAASSAAPFVLSPVTIWNHVPADWRNGCGQPEIDRLMAAARSGASSRRLAELRALRAVDGEGVRRPFIHLLDGGLSDNVTAGGPLDFVDQFGDMVEGSRAVGLRGIRRAVFIIVNAETSVRAPEDRSADVPGPLRAALALADIPINRNSGTTLGQMRSAMAAWQQQVRQAHARGDFETFAADASLHLVEVSLADAPDAMQRERLLAIPTTLQLTPQDVALLRRYARDALARSADFQRLLGELR